MLWPAVRLAGKAREARVDLYEALYTTRSMRRLKPDPIPYEAQGRILDAAIHAPTIGEGWRFILVDDRAVMARLAPFYRQGFERLLGQQVGSAMDELRQSDSPVGRTLRSAIYLVEHFHEVPLLLIGCGQDPNGSGVHPALWSAMLAARAEGIGSTLTGVLHTFFGEEVFAILGAPMDAGWHIHGIVALGYPIGRWGVGARGPVHEVAARNTWEGDLGFTVPETLWPK
jgi:nitroreductase